MNASETDDGVQHRSSDTPPDLIISKLAQEQEFVASVLRPMSELNGAVCFYAELSERSDAEYREIAEAILVTMLERPFCDVALACMGSYIARKIICQLVDIMPSNIRDKIVLHTHGSIHLQFDESDVRKISFLHRAFPPRGVSSDVLFYVAER